MTTATEPTRWVELGALGMDEGAQLLLRRALRGLAVDAVLGVHGSHPLLGLHLEAWCRARGCRMTAVGDTRFEIRQTASGDRWHQATRAGTPETVQATADGRWGMAARGALVEPGTPDYHFPLDQQDALWGEEAAHLYAQAVAGQWNPDSAIDWSAPFELADEVEDAVVQVMSYLVENENAALLVPARFLGQMHPHYREVVQCLAITVADEARHVEVFSRRIALRGRLPGRSTVGGQASLKTLFDVPDFSVSSMLLAVLGEGTFVNLLNFLHAHGPDPVTRQICRLAARDEARHVAFGMSHLAWHLARDPDERLRLQQAIDARYDALADTDGLNEDVFDALVLLAAGSLEPEAIATGHARVDALKREMVDGRRARLLKLGFAAADAGALAERHTRNFM